MKKSMKKIIFLTVIIFQFLSLALFGDTIEYTYYFTKPQITKQGDYHRIEMDGLMSISKPGEPELPSKSVQLLLLPGEQAVSISVIYKGINDLLGEYRIYPRQRPYPIGYQGEVEFTEPDPEIYNSDKPFPEKLHTEIQTQYLRGHSIAILNIFPVQYMPASGEVSYFSEMKVVIETEPTVEAENSFNDFYRNDKITNERVRNIIDNPEQIRLYPSQSNTRAGDNKYVIITSSTYSSYFDSFAEFKTKQGYNVLIKTTNDIYSEYSGVDNQDKIRNFIKYAYLDLGTEYVLLGGDVEIVPHRGFWINTGYGTEDYDIPADLYYAALDRVGSGTGPDWNVDNDSKWGETSEADYYAEVYIGRISADSGTEFSAALNKQTMYQQSPVVSDLEKAIMVGEQLDDDPLTWGGTYKDEIMNGGYYNGYTTTGFPGNFTVQTQYERSGSWSWTDLRDKMNAGKNIINHHGHSNPDFNMKFSRSYVTNTNLTSNGTNHNFYIIYSQGCTAAGFDNRWPDGWYDPVDCIAEKFTTISNGCVAFIGNSRYGWYNPGGTDVGSQYLDRQFFDALFGENIYKLGEMNEDSKEDGVSQCNSNPWFRWSYYCVNLLGDPSLDVWTDAPATLAPSYASSINVTDNQLYVSVGISGTLVGLSQNGNHIGSGITNASGNVTIIFDNSPSIGTMDIYISAHNYSIHTGTITVSGGSALEPPTNLSVTELGYATWDPPVEMIFFDDFESYIVGEYLAVQSSEWTTWTNTPGSSEDAFVSDEQALSGTKSVKVEGNITDLVHEYGNLTTGHYLVTHHFYIVSGYGGYYNLLHNFTGASSEWGFEAYFAVDGTGYISAGGTDAATFTYTPASWTKCVVDIDLDNDWAIFFVNDVQIYEWQWSLQAHDGAPGMCQLGATDIFAYAPPGEDAMYYFDDISLAVVQARDELTGYKIYLDSGYVDFTTNLFWQYSGLTSGVNYTAGVSALYDEGESDIIEEPFTYIQLTADFTADVTSGIVPLTVNFTDLSTGNPTTWQWDFQNDGTIDSYVQNPVWIYTETGIYTVSLTVSDGTNTDTEIKTDYITVSGGPALEPPTSLSVTILGYATWDSPSGGATGILAHHNGYDGIGVGTGSTASWISAARFDATDLATYYGSNLTEVNIHIRSTDFSYVEARVYEGGSFGDPGTLIYAQDITSFVLIEDWTNHVLTTPIPLVAGNEYWIGYYMDATGDHPASVDAGPAVPGKGDWMFYSGAWVEISTEYGIDKNWCIEGVVGVTDYIRDKVISTKNISSQPPGSMVTLGIPKAAFNHPKQRYDRASDTRALLGYKVYLDGEYVDFTTNLFWQYTGLTSGVTYTAGVSALYDEGESNIIEEPFTYSDTIYVKQDGTGDVTTIQAGIDIAQNGNVVLVYQGTYIENINFNGKNITVGSLFLTTLDTTYISQTIINGNHSGRVVSINSGEDLTALLTGFTITNGYASGDWPNDLGAGIFIDNSSPTISYCIISGNSADGCGAGITWLGLSSPIISNCTISWNSAPNSVAGGILCQSSEMANPPSIENCTIENNSALSGAGVYLRDNTTVRRCLVINNSALASGGGGNGGGFYCYENSPTIENCVISGNSADNSAGAIRLNSVTLTMINTIVEGNFGNEGINFLDASSSSFIYSDFYNNQGGDFGGDPPAGLGIITGVNANGDPCDEFFNIFLDPLFASTRTDSSYYLTESSPCIDAGDPSSPLDPDGTIADMGAFYFDQSSPPSIPTNVIIYIQSDSVHITWDPVPGCTYNLYSSTDPYATKPWLDVETGISDTSWSAPLTDEKKFYYVTAVASPPTKNSSKSRQSK